MKRFKLQLKEKDILFLEKNLKNKDIILKNRKDCDKKLYLSNAQIFLNLNDVESILNELGDIFSLKGLNADSEPNLLGLQIEDLIDIFNNLLLGKEENFDSQSNFEKSIPT